VVVVVVAQQPMTELVVEVVLVVIAHLHPKD
jgi:hypothetical protein